jgi:DNA-binding NarL/FixJ family response regulator
VGNLISLNDNQNIRILGSNGSIDFKLSKRELEVLEFMCEGKSTLEMSEQFFLSQRTIKNYRANLLSKTNSKNSAELIIYAIKNRLISIKF